MRGEVATLLKAGAVLTVAIPFATVVWYAAVHDADAESQKTEQSTLVQAVEKLTAIHERQETVEQAERALRARLCAEHKLAPEECPRGSIGEDDDG